MTNDPRLPESGYLSASSAARLAERLGGLDDLQGRLVSMMASPESGSTAEAEVRAIPAAVLPYIHARALLVSALDHLNAFRLIVLEARMVPAFALMTLLRSALESALQARWVVGGDSVERLARRFYMEWDSFNERRKLEVSIGQGSLAQGRIDQLLDEADLLGLVERDRNGVRRLRRSCPTYIELMTQLSTRRSRAGGDSWVYRLLSGYAHAKSWATTMAAVPDPSPGTQPRGGGPS